MSEKPPIAPSVSLPTTLANRIRSSGTPSTIHVILTTSVRVPGACPPSHQPKATPIAKNATDANVSSTLLELLSHLHELLHPEIQIVDVEQDVIDLCDGHRDSRQTRAQKDPKSLVALLSS